MQENDQWLEADILPMHSVLNNVYNALIAADIIKCIARKWPMIGGWYFANAFSIK